MPSGVTRKIPASTVAGTAATSTAMTRRDVPRNRDLVATAPDEEGGGGGSAPTAGGCWGTEDVGRGQAATVTTSPPGYMRGT